MKRIFTTIIFCLLASLSSAQDHLAKWDNETSRCVTGVYKHPNSPFAITLFCEGALGSYLSVTHLGPIGAPSTSNRKWSLNDRHWKDSVWGNDVTGFEWSADGTRLIVSTSPIYGSGGYFELDLKNRTFTQLSPKEVKVSTSKPGPGYSISGKEYAPDRY